MIICDMRRRRRSHLEQHLYGIPPAFGSSFEFFSFRAIAFFASILELDHRSLHHISPLSIQIIMVDTRMSPERASKASKSPQGSKTAPPTPLPSSSKSSRGSKSGGVSKPTPKAKRTSQGRFRSAISSPDTLSADEIPETDLEPESEANANPKYRKMFCKLAKTNGGKE